MIPPPPCHHGKMHQMIDQDAPQSMILFLGFDPQDMNLAQRGTSVPSAEGDADLNAILCFQLQPESCRFIAYTTIWTMCILTIILTHTIVAPALMDGPEPGKPL